MGLSRRYRAPACMQARPGQAIILRTHIVCHESARSRVRMQQRLARGKECNTIGRESQIMFVEREDLTYVPDIIMPRAQWIIPSSVRLAVSS